MENETICMNGQKDKFYFFFSLMAISSLLFLTGCGYHFGNGPLSMRYHTISVPYAEGDFDGSFTTEVIKQISTAGVFKYKRTASDLILKIRLIDFDNENIGFQYYVNKENKKTRETIPIETRLSVTAEVSVIDAVSGAEVLTPVRISASTDFDHDYYSTKEGINEFSIG